MLSFQLRFAGNNVSRPLLTLVQRSYATTPQSSSKDAEAKLLDKQKKLQQKFAERQKNLEKKSSEREKKKVQQLKKWEFEEKIRKLRDLQIEKERRARDKARMRETVAKEKIRIKQLQQKMREKQKIKEKKAGKPKRAVLPFFFYVKEAFESEREKLQTAQQTTDKILVTDVTKSLREKFSTMSQEEKQRYVDLTAEDRERYTREMEQYRSEKQKNKRPLSGFMLFCKDARSQVAQEVAEQTNLQKRQLAVEIISRLGKKWNLLSPEEKSVYKKQYDDAKRDYDATKKVRKE